jgi:2-desacetyl-2-hydroxyethyl bacteriochlorophyllide A dehydrogenase
MKAAMFYRRKEIEIIDIPKPEIGANQVLVRVKSCGICGTDNLIFNGQCYAKTPLTLGHEYSGDIVEIGKDVKHLRAGDRVVIDPNIFCNKCAFCKIGKVHLCDNLVSLGVIENGGFAEFSVVPDTNIHKIDPAIDYDEGALVEPLACCVHGMERAGLEAGDTVLVTGAGIIGNIMVQLSRLQGAGAVIAVEPIEKRRKIARDLGADLLLDPSAQNIKAEIKRMFPAGVDALIECSGSLEAQEMSQDLVKKGGTILLFGCSPEDRRLALSPFKINHNEIKVVGSTNNPFTHARAINLISNGRIKLKPLISHRMPLEKLAYAFEIFGSEETTKIVINPNS